MKTRLVKLLAVTMLLVGVGSGLGSAAEADANGAPYVVSQRTFWSSSGACAVVITEYSNGDRNLAYVGLC